MSNKVSNDAERLEHIAAKVPSSVKHEIDRIVKRERRNKSNVVWLLLERGLHEYRKDSKLTGWEGHETEEGKRYPVGLLGQAASGVHEGADSASGARRQKPKRGSR